MAKTRGLKRSRDVKAQNVSNVRIVNNVIVDGKETKKRKFSEYPRLSHRSALKLMTLAERYITEEQQEIVRNAGLGSMINLSIDDIPW